jgi:hypothetical protein
LPGSIPPRAREILNSERLPHTKHSSCGLSLTASQSARSTALLREMAFNWRIFSAPISTTEPFMVENQFSRTGTTTHRTTFGPWGNVTNKYLGLKFLIGGKIHYGWARLTVMGYSSVTLTGYAYETTVGKPIKAGHTTGPEKSATEEISPTTLTAPVARKATLGLLALGAPGLSIWRREESFGAAQ